MQSEQRLGEWLWSYAAIVNGKMDARSNNINVNIAARYGFEIVLKPIPTSSFWNGARS
jgi:hypothetical protein